MSLNSSTTRDNCGCRNLGILGGISPPLLVLCQMQIQNAVTLKVFDCVPLHCLGSIWPQKPAQIQQPFTFKVFHGVLLHCLGSVCRLGGPHVGKIFLSPLPFRGSPTLGSEAYSELATKGE